MGTANETIGYTASGSSADWVLGVAKIPYSFAMELPPFSEGYGYEGFHLAEDRIVPTGEEVWAFHETIANEIIKEFSP